MSKPRLTSIAQLPPPQLDHEEVEIGEFSVLVWALDAHEIQRWEKGHVTVKGGRVVRLHRDTATARLLAAAIKDDAGRPMFTVADINELMKQSAADVSRIERVARRLSGLTEEPADGDEEESKDEHDTVDEAGAEGNGYTPRTPSSTISHLPSGVELVMNS